MGTRFRRPLAVISLGAFDWNYTHLISALATNSESAALNIFVLALIAFAIGEFLDAIRNGFLEPIVMDGWLKKAITWDFFFDGKDEHVRHLTEHYFTWYVADVNLGQAVLLGWLIGFLLCLKLNSGSSLSAYWSIAVLVIVLIFWRDAWTLREDIRENINRVYPTGK